MPVYFAQLVKTVRVKSRLTQKEAAAALGIPVSTFKSWEYNRCLPSFRNLDRLQLLNAAYSEDIENAWLHEKLLFLMPQLSQSRNAPKG